MLVLGKHDLNAALAQYLVECGAELPVAVSDQVPDRAADVLQVHDRVPGGLGQPTKQWSAL